MFVIEEKVLLIFFFYSATNCFLISSSRAPKNKSKRGALFSECGVLWAG